MSTEQKTQQEDLTEAMNQAIRLAMDNWQKHSGLRMDSMDGRVGEACGAINKLDTCVTKLWEKLGQIESMQKTIMQNQQYAWQYLQAQQPAPTSPPAQFSIPSQQNPPIQVPWPQQAGPVLPPNPANAGPQDVRPVVMVCVPSGQPQTQQGPPQQATQTQPSFVNQPTGNGSGAYDPNYHWEKNSTNLKLIGSHLGAAVLGMLFGGFCWPAGGAGLMNALPGIGIGSWCDYEQLT